MSDVNFPYTIAPLNEVGQNNISINYDRRPDKCPICHHGILADPFYSFWNRKLSSDHPKALQILFRCPMENCRNIFIGYYSYNLDSGRFSFSGTLAPFEFQKKYFSDFIQNISPSFIEIYNQSLEAENRNLLLICGPGYRKALEFLIKDYLIKRTVDLEEREKIRKEFLGVTVKNRIKVDNIQKVAQRAVWLGNDETHYVRKWEDKDITDLKHLINLTVGWINMDEETNKALEEMPEGK